MVEGLGAAHQDDCCDAGCRQEHAFHFVRVRAGVDVARRRQGAAIDLKLDLHPRLRASRPETLICMTQSELEVHPSTSPKVKLRSNAAASAVLMQSMFQLVCSVACSEQQRCIVVASLSLWP